MRNKRVLLLAFFLIILSSFALAQLELPENVLKIIDFNEQQAAKISFIIAFLGGVFSLISPCVLPILPAFFAYAFKEKKDLIKMTTMFFLGAALIFVLMGIAASFIGNVLDKNRQVLTVVAGFLLIVFGSMTILGKGFTFFKMKGFKPKHDTLGIFLFGVLFSIGFTPCVGPILSGILVMAASIQNYLHSGILLLTYSIGLLLPMFIMAFLYDKYKLSEKSWVKGKDFQVGSFHINTNKLIAGILLIIMGVIFIIYKSTSIVNTIDPLNTKDYFYSTQRDAIAWDFPKTLGNILGLIVIIIFSLFLWKSWKKRSNRQI